MLNFIVAISVYILDKIAGVIIEGVTKDAINHLSNQMKDSPYYDLRKFPPKRKKH